MDRIIPHLWFDDVAEEAVNFYISLFEDSELVMKQQLEGTPSGAKTMIYGFKLAGQRFEALNGGPGFIFNPSISLSVICDSEEEIDTLWEKLGATGKELMPLQKYPFSKYYGWIEDKYGVSWQLIHSEGVEYQQKITTQLMFSGTVTGKAEEAMQFYADLFKDGAVTEISKYEAGQAEHPDAEVAHGKFTILGTEMLAADNGNLVDYHFNEAFSLILMCITQAEIDYYWEKLSAVPEAEQCGWLKDKYGVSWQIIPAEMNELLTKGTAAQINAVVEAFLPMKKINLEKLENTWELARK